jgi:uncharacterized protein YaaW (UPF0174 family)
MREILQKCQPEDFVYLSKVLDSYLSFTNDKRRRELIGLSAESPNSRAELVELVDKQIRYYGSSDLAYLRRALFEDDAGVASLEIIEDVCTKLKVRIKKGGSLETRMERLVYAVVEEELVNKSPEELTEAFKDIGVGNAEINTIIEHLKKNAKVAVLPVLIEVLGPKIALGVIETIIVSLLAQIVGKEAAKQLVRELAKRNPWINSLGPVLWVISGVWLAYDMQGPAFRKTVPIALYLGIVALRDGSEDEKTTRTDHTT